MKGAEKEEKTSASFAIASDGTPRDCRLRSTGKAVQSTSLGSGQHPIRAGRIFPTLRDSLIFGGDNLHRWRTLGGIRVAGFLKHARRRRCQHAPATGPPKFERDARHIGVAWDSVQLRRPCDNNS